ncbi:MAG: caspase family protein [Actinobacteria bacterium]|nr:caspase family protein [Actinomycetota bacterium]
MTQGRRLALLVATTEYDDIRLDRLAAPLEDALELARVLRDRGGFEVETLINAEAQTVQRRVERFCKTDRSRDDLLLLYLTGHGVKDDDGNLYFALRDTDRDLLRTTAVGADLVNAVMNDSPARSQVLMIDCCYSGAYARALRAKGSAVVELGDTFTGGRGRVVLAASGAVEQAWEGDTGSVYTRAVVDGIATGAADTDGDGRITASELHSHVAEQLRLQGRQTPKKFEFDEAGDLVLATTGETAGVVHTPPVRSAAAPSRQRELPASRRPRGRRWAVGAVVLVVGLGGLWAALRPTTPTVLAGLAPTMTETYTGNERGWAEGQFTDGPATYAFGFDRGRYLVDFTSTTGDQTYWSTIEYGPLEEPYAVQVETATNTANSRCGLAVGGSDSLVVVSLGDGEVVAQLAQGSATSALGRWPASVPLGVSAVVSIRVEDSTATVYVDGTEVGSFPTPLLARATRVGVAAWGESVASCGFEEVSIHE